jgi:hypothetical protein
MPMSDQKEKSVCVLPRISEIIKKSDDCRPEDSRQAIFETDPESMVNMIYDLVETIIDRVPIEQRGFFKRELARIRRLQEVEDKKLVWNYLSPEIKQ